jgi:hypothetical protein
MRVCRTPRRVRIEADAVTLVPHEGHAELGCRARRVEPPAGAGELPAVLRRIGGAHLISSSRVVLTTNLRRGRGHAIAARGGGYAQSSVMRRCRMRRSGPVCASPSARWYSARASPRRSRFRRSGLRAGALRARRPGTPRSLRVPGRASRRACAARHRSGVQVLGVVDGEASQSWSGESTALTTLQS